MSKINATLKNLKRKRNRIYWITEVLLHCFLNSLVIFLRAANIIKSGRRDSNPLPTAWEAVALPGELLPHIY